MTATLLLFLAVPLALALIVALVRREKKRSEAMTEEEKDREWMDQQW